MIQGGTSGGPWINERGEFVGLQSGTLLVGDSPCGLAFMAPVDRFREVIENRASASTRNLDFRAEPLESQNLAVLENVERDLITRALERHSGSTAAAARELGIHRSTLWRKIKRYGLANP